jgi:LPXTG-motif cell wall-anchored protein
MEFILMDVKASDDILSGNNLVILVIATLVGIAALTAVFIWRKKKNKK